MVWGALTHANKPEVTGLPGSVTRVTSSFTKCTARCLTTLLLLCFCIKYSILLTTREFTIVQISKLQVLLTSSPLNIVKKKKVVPQLRLKDWRTEERGQPQ